MKVTAYKQDIGQQYNNPFKDNQIDPYTKIGRVVVDTTTGEIRYHLDEKNSLVSSTGFPVELKADEDIMVVIPKFYCRRTRNGDVVEDSILSQIPTTRYMGGYEVHPVFIRTDGTIRPYILYGAFKGTEVSGQLRSVSGSLPAVSKTITQFRTLARQGRDSRFNIETIQAVSAVQLLYKAAFQNLNSQQELGNGWTIKPAAVETGGTIPLGNRSGYYGTNGNQISLFGIEDFFGNVWSFVDGLLVTDDGYYTTNNPDHFGEILSHAHTPASPTQVNGYARKIESMSGDDKFLNILTDTSGSPTIGYCDYLYSHDPLDTNIAIFGGTWGDGSNSGAWCLRLSHVASYDSSFFGSRLCFYP